MKETELLRLLKLHLIGLLSPLQENSLLTLDPFLVQTPSPLRPLMPLTPQLVTNHMDLTPHLRVLLMEEVLLMEPTEVVAVTLLVHQQDLLEVTHHPLMVLHQEDQETMVLQAMEVVLTVVTVSKN
jgi:hypothetical protein